MLSTKQRLLCLAVFAAMTTACSTGGGNLNAGGGTTGSTIPGNGSTTPETPKTQYEKVDLETSTVAKINKESDAGSAEPTPEPEYGYSIASPFTGGYTHATLSDEQKEENASINTKDAYTNTNADDYDTLNFINNPENQAAGKTKQVTITKDGFTSDAYDYHPEAETAEGTTINADIKDNMVLVIDANTFETLKMVEFDHTKAGAVFNGQDPKYANIFYRGKDASELLPSNGVAEYNGLWEVVRTVEINPGEAIAGYGGGSFNSRAPADFTVDFANKSISGNLKKNFAKEQAFAYTLAGNIKGNIFEADASSTDDATNLDTAKVTGGFFGEQGMELAGKLLSDKAAGVFAAKQTSSDGLTAGEAAPEVIYNQAKSINLDENQSPIFVTNFEDVIAGTQKLPNINEIILNGVKINLLTEADKENSNVFANSAELPLQFTRIGAVQTDAKKPMYTYFYQGQLTQAMPTDGSAKYEGNWIGYGQAESGTPYSMSKASDGRIKFNADFASKALSGEFFTAAGNNAMTLNNVKIMGNTFTGKANITSTGLSNDKDGNQGQIKGDVAISGGFFGDKANELSGQFNKEDNSFAGVFAGKQTK